MGVRQYIGARYVPKFYEGSNGSAWDQGVMYEPLVIVSYLNNYYTSKKTVPATVGAPNLNPEYWANIGLLGDIESRLSAVENEVDTLEGTTDSLVERADNNFDFINSKCKKWNPLTNGKIVFLGNSYGKDSTIWNKWPDVAANVLGIGVEGNNWWNACVSGHAMSTGEFLADLQTWFNSHESEANNIGAVVCVAGLNDSYADPNHQTGYEGIYPAMSTLVTWIHANLPNAQAFFGYTGFVNKAIATTDFRTGTYRNAAMIEYHRCSELGCVYLNGVENILHDKRYLDSDGVHPSQGGALKIGVGVAQALMNGSVDTYANSNTIQLTPDSGSVGGNIVQRQFNGTLFNILNAFQIDYSSLDTKPTYNAGTEYKVGTMSLPFTNAITIGEFSVPTVVVDSQSGFSIINTTITIRIDDSNNVYYKINAFSDNVLSHEVITFSEINETVAVYIQDK